MEVNKKRLSEIFGVSVRTIQNWQEQGMPVVRGGGKGNEVLFESAAAIEWYSARDAAIENEKLRKEVEDLRIASESDLQPGTIEYERHRLTRAQADAQELKNAKESAEVVETAFCTFVLSRVPTLREYCRTPWRTTEQSSTSGHSTGKCVPMSWLLKRPLLKLIRQWPNFQRRCRRR